MALLSKYGDLFMTDDQCNAFLAYLREMDDMQLASTLQDYDYLCHRDRPLWDQFVWKREQARAEMQRRNGSG